jgi:hypothetical protein
LNRAARVATAALGAACGLVIVVELVRPLVGDPHTDRPRALEFVGSYALYGFVACVLLVMLGRLLRRAVMRPEEYWSDRQ